MKQHEFKGQDQCVYCHGTSSTQSECVERKQSYVVNGIDETFTCDYPVCHYLGGREDCLH